MTYLHVSMLSEETTAAALSQLPAANFTANEAQQLAQEQLVNEYLSHETLAEGLFLMLVGVMGMLMNTVILVMTCTCAHLRLMMNGFTVHGCLLDTLKVKVIYNVSSLLQGYDNWKGVVLLLHWFILLKCIFYYCCPAHTRTSPF